ncbi:MAG: cupin domain-containing protein [Clostridiales bacterium]|nr:cupin domain-containing protein [Clostridiales bacterium]
MEISVRKPTAAQVEQMQACPVWGCGVSEFDWQYDQKETALLIEGEVTVAYDGKSVSFGAGDYVEFPAGLSCAWKVAKPVSKHYKFG